MPRSMLAQALASNPELMHLVFESMPEPTFMLNREGIYVEAWGGTDTRRHHNPATIIGLDQYQVLPEDKARWFTKVIQQVIDTGKPTELEYELDPKQLPAFKGIEGPTQLQYFSAFVIPLTGHQLVLWTVRNITEYKNALSRLETQQSELERLTYTDHLTQLNNRYALESMLPPAISVAKHAHKSAALFMIDIDHFKELNDEYGHLKGDQALKSIAEEISLWCKGRGIAFRYGGDEFLVFMREAGKHNCTEIAAELSERIRALAIPNTGSEVADVLTVTIGIKVCQLDKELRHIEYYINMADKALFSAKKLERGSIHLLE